MDAERRRWLGQAMAAGLVLAALPGEGWAGADPVAGAPAWSLPPLDALDAFDATGLAALVARRKVSPGELLDRALRRAAAIAPLKALSVMTEEVARAALAKPLSGPFAGVPFLLKDLAVELQGTRTTNGSRFFAEQAAATADGELVQRFKRAGLVIFGKTTCPELGLSSSTESALHGPTRNPWNVARVAGGSSGGAAVATRDIDYLVEPTLDGSSESVWRVRAEQGGDTVLTANVAFGLRRDGFNHAARWVTQPPMPEELPSLSQLLGELGNELSVHGRSRTRTYPQVEVRPVNARRHLLADPGAPRSEFWIRSVPVQSTAPLPAAGVLAYLSDYLAVNAALAGHVPELPELPMFVASLNHSIWFHAEPVPGEWLYHELESPWAGGGRALCLGRIYSRAGDLQATVAQEMLIGIRRA